MKTMSQLGVSARPTGHHRDAYHVPEGYRKLARHEVTQPGDCYLNQATLTRGYPDEVSMYLGRTSGQLYDMGLSYVIRKVEPKASRRPTLLKIDGDYYRRLQDQETIQEGDRWENGDYFEGLIGSSAAVMAGTGGAWRRLEIPKGYRVRELDEKLGATDGGINIRKNGEVAVFTELPFGKCEHGPAALAKGLTVRDYIHTVLNNPNLEDILFLAKVSVVAAGHNPDGVTEDQLGLSEGWRLLALEEVDTKRAHQPDIQALNYKGEWSFGWYGSSKAKSYRTKRPVGYFLPKSPVASGHNSDNLTEKQVGVSEGYRLLALDEIYDKPQSKDIDAWLDGSWDNKYLWKGDSETITYRTKQPAGYFLPPAKSDLDLAREEVVALRNQNVLLKARLLDIQMLASKKDGEVAS